MRRHLTAEAVAEGSPQSRRAWMTFFMELQISGNEVIVPPWPATRPMRVTAVAQQNLTALGLPKPWFHKTTPEWVFVAPQHWLWQVKKVVEVNPHPVARQRAHQMAFPANIAAQADNAVMVSNGKYVMLIEGTFACPELVPYRIKEGGWMSRDGRVNDVSKVAQLDRMHTHRQQLDYLPLSDRYHHMDCLLSFLMLPPIDSLSNLKEIEENMQERLWLRDEMQRVELEASATKPIAGTTTETLEKMFQPQIFITSDFPIVVADDLSCVPIKSLDSHTVVFCPKHENGNYADHHASAYVGLTSDGRHFVYCSVCSPDNGLMMEEVIEGDTSDLSSICNNIEYLDVDYLSKEHFLPSPDVLAKGLSKAYLIVIISDMCTGKTRGLSDMLQSSRTELRAITGRAPSSNFLDNLQILSISPRTLLAKFSANTLRLKDYNEVIQGVVKDRRAIKSGRRGLGALGAVATDAESETRQACNNALCITPKLSICIQSIAKLRQRATNPYDVIILDELRMNAEHLVSSIGAPDLLATHKVYELLNRDCALRICMGADIDVPSVLAMFPDVDFNDPQQCQIRVNRGGKGGIKGHQYYVTHDIFDALEALLSLVQAGENVYVPTNQSGMGEAIMKMLACVIPASEILFVHRTSSDDDKAALLRDPVSRLFLNTHENTLFRFEPY